MKDEIKSFFKNIPIFSELTDGELTSLMEVTVETKVKPGNAVFKEGDEGRAMYVLMDGAVKIIKNIRGEQEKILAHLGRGSIFGEMALIEGQKRSATAIAERASSLFEITRSDFNSLIEINPVAGFKIMYGIARILSARLRRMDEEFIKIFSQPFRAIVELQSILEGMRKNYISFGFEENLFKKGKKA